MQILSRLKWPLAVASLLWLSMIAPWATIAALLSDEAFYSFWTMSLWALPAVFLMMMAVFRIRNRSLRWLVFQYLGVSSVCFSAALCGAILSSLLSNVAAGVWALLLALLFCAWGIVAAHRIHTVNITIVNSKIGDKLCLVHISDVHIGSRNPAFLQKVLDQVQLHTPDVLVITGDLIDEAVSARDMAPLASMSCPVLYCSGNHERYIDYEQALRVIAAQGVQVLTNQSIDILGLRVIGIEDQQHRHAAVASLDKLLGDCALEAAAAPTASVAPVPPFTVLLYHQPDIWEAARRHGIELMLSGHTHNGQVWPFGWLVRTRYPYLAGHFQSSLNHLFVSQGTGTWGPHMRFGTRCEMTVIELQAR